MQALSLLSMMGLPLSMMAHVHTINPPAHIALRVLVL